VQGKRHEGKAKQLIDGASYDRMRSTRSGAPLTRPGRKSREIAATIDVRLKRLD
jgi:hypothetical protein